MSQRTAWCGGYLQMYFRSNQGFHTGIELARQESNSGLLVPTEVVSSVMMGPLAACMTLPALFSVSLARIELGSLLWEKRFWTAGPWRLVCCIGRHGPLQWPFFLRTLRQCTGADLQRPPTPDCEPLGGAAASAPLTAAPAAPWKILPAGRAGG